MVSSSRARALAGLTLSLLVACGGTETGAGKPKGCPVCDQLAAGQTVVVKNDGTETWEGHTPRGFAGKGTGLFIGDNFNKVFPNGDGVQFYLTFHTGALRAGSVGQARLSSVPIQAYGTPFHDLGPVIVEELRYDRFGKELWNRDAMKVEGCRLELELGDRIDCDLSTIVRSAIAGSRDRVQIRIRFETASDRDGKADVAAFFLSTMDTNQKGIFQLTLAPTGKSLGSGSEHAPALAGRKPSARLPHSVASFQHWPRINKTAFESKTHARAFVDIYVNPEHSKAYRARTKPMPVGATIVKAQHKNNGGNQGALQNLSVMVKMQAGYDGPGGDWYYGVYSPDGRSVSFDGNSEGQTALCVTCHQSAPGDHLFGVSASSE